MDDPARVPTPALGELINQFDRGKRKKEYFYPCLELKLSSYPDFSEIRHWMHLSRTGNFEFDIRVEEFDGNGAAMNEGILIGMDIGSTSTKAMVSDPSGKPLLGYYTYTSGKPVQAVKVIFSALEQYLAGRSLRPNIPGTGTTGSGRQLAGRIMDADLVVDEITAHARSARHLDPATDTIIEIGGQDAKFTVLKNGEVVFFQMNAVCAAGTGSFIEEQAQKLGVPLEEYAERAMGVESPLTSDRCTVFMERDLNFLVNRGYSVEELLSATLFSVRENYLRKVATEGMIGRHVCFQGATARNRALVAAFEQKLGQPVRVSRFCHLTGAMGVNLLLAGEMPATSNFRGLAVHRQVTPVRTEVCDLCNNRCKLTIATLDGREVAYGFLCGRDYDTPRYIKKNAGCFDLVKEWQRVFRIPKQPDGKAEIGIPAGLHMFGEVKFWEHFFGTLGFSFSSSRTEKGLLKLGKHYAGAEFCAPIESMYGHVISLADKAEHIFLPVYLESRERSAGRERNYCYYTQFSPSMIAQVGSLENRFIIPGIDFHFGSRYNKKAVYNALRSRFGERIDPTGVSEAWDKARDHLNRLKRNWKKRFLISREPGEFSVVLLGRPYIVLSRELNKNIPDYFTRQGVSCYFQDMLPESGDNGDLLCRIPWHFASEILGAAGTVADTPGLYPVMITAFKCAPDSFILEYFKKIMEAAGKPYLILQTDEHDSGVGYETRIEAALRAFRNHHSNHQVPVKARNGAILPAVADEIGGKTLLIPNWDPYSLRLLAAMLRRKGIDARILETSETGMRKSMVHNTGQCIPLNIIAQGFIDYVEHNALDPSNTLLWMSGSNLSCNYRLYPEYLKTLLDNYGRGFQRADVYLGEVSNLDISLNACIRTCFVYMLGGLVRKLGCRIRPYEASPGETDRVIDESMDLLERAFSGVVPMETAVGRMAGTFSRIRTRQNGQKPEVAIFGDFYIRDHDVMNQGLIRFIERAGGEVVTTPYHDYVKITSANVVRRMHKRGDHPRAVLARVLLTIMDRLDRKYYRQFESIIGAKVHINPESLEKHLDDFFIKPYHSGESYENILKIFHILENHPGLSLFVQTNPVFCCPALVTEAMTARIKSITGVPVVTVTYDGTSESKNEVLLPYLVAASEKLVNSAP